MGGGHSVLTPLPPNYITVTFRPPDELWLCQAPSHLIDFIRSLLFNVWPHHAHLERACNTIDLKFKKNSSEKDYIHPPMLNTVFRIPADPFTVTPNHQTQSEAEAAYQFMMLLVAYLYSLEYDMIASGHFVRGTEANTCVFRCSLDRRGHASMTQLIGDRRIRKQSFLRHKLPKGIDLPESKRMLVVGLEGWNKLYLINANNQIVQDVLKEFRKTWLKKVNCSPIPDSLQTERSNGKRHSTTAKSGSTPLEAQERTSSFLIEFEGHPWDSYKEHSNITPILIIKLIDVLEKSGFLLACRTNFRGLLDSLFFERIQQKFPRKTVARMAFSLCHQNCIRVYGGTPAFCSWITQLLQHLWIAGIAYEKWIDLEPEDGTIPEEDEQRDGILEYSEVQLIGAPWCIPEWNRDNLLAVQYMMARFAGVLFLVGWKCRVALNAYSSPYDKCLLVFEKEINSDQSLDELFDLEVTELLTSNDDDPKNMMDLLMPACFSTYDIDRLCILGGSRTFLENFNARFTRLFDGILHRNKDREIDKALHNSKGDGFLLPEGWIDVRSPFYPELVNKVFLGDGNSALCLLPQTKENLVLTAIAELDPENSLEYAANYRMWSTNCYWPPKMFKKTKPKFFYRSQLPLAVLCWINELFLTAPAYLENAGSQPAETEHNGSCNDGEICEKVEISAAPKHAEKTRRMTTKHVRRTNEKSLVACFDCSSTVNNAPPAWIYLVRCREDRFVNPEANTKSSSE